VKQAHKDDSVAFSCKLKTQIYLLIMLTGIGL